MTRCLPFVLLIGLAGFVRGRKSYLDRLPNGAVFKEDASIGHASTGGGGTRTGFGEHFKAANRAWTISLCNMDSDGDGRTNGQELGDPCCVWRQGDEPACKVGISNPGQVGSTSNTCDCPSGGDGGGDSGDSEDDGGDSTGDNDGGSGGGSGDDTGGTGGDSGVGTGTGGTSGGTAGSTTGTLGGEESAESRGDTISAGRERETNSGASSTTTSPRCAAGSMLCFPVWIVVHGACMIIAWFFIIPCGVLVAALRNTVGAKWMALHQAANLAGTVLTVAGGAVAIASTVSHGATHHSILGLAVFAASVPMAASGLLRPQARRADARLEPKSSSAAFEVGSTPATTHVNVEHVENGKAAQAATLHDAPKRSVRVLWEAAHKNIGRALLMLAIATAVLGMMLVV